MVMLRRRTLLAGVATSLALAGCQERAGHSPMLRLRNRRPERGSVRIVAFRRYVGEGREEARVYEETVSVDAESTTEFELFTASDQYRVRVERGDHRVEFQTRPICSDASTTVTLRSGGGIAYRVEFCEGNPRTGTSTSS